MSDHKKYPREFLIELGSLYGEMIYDLAHEANIDLAKQLGVEDSLFEEVKDDLVQERLFFMLHVVDRIAFMVFGVEQREPFVLSSIKSVLTKVDPSHGAVAERFNQTNNQKAIEYGEVKTIVGELMQSDSLTGMYANKMASILSQPLNAKMQFIFSAEATNLFKTLMEVLGKYTQE